MNADFENSQRKTPIVKDTTAETEPGTAPYRGQATELIEGEDYYVDGAAIVFTARYHLRRGYCCESGCRHCPYRSIEMTKEA